FNRAIKKLYEDGTIAELTEKWASVDDSIKTLPEQDWDAPNGTLKFATTGTLEPFSYAGPGGEAIGFDVDLALHIAKELGYHVDTQMIGMDAIVASVDSGKVDFGGTLTYTEERAKAVDFSDSVMPVSVSVVVRAKDPVAQQQSLSSWLKESFHKTFIEEDRWLLILGGLGVTLLISVCAGVLGAILGFGTVMLRRRGTKWAEKLVTGYQAVMGGVPIVVWLMLFYYVVFGGVDIAGEIVAIIAFTLAFGATSGSTMWTAIEGIDVIQEETGLALGYTRGQTFRKIIFPQAMQQFLPQLMGQFVSLMKETAVVGYIAVQDLTRVGDLIRARTMDAFFPLIAIAIIYFIACRVLARVIGRITAKMKVENRPRTVEGVDMGSDETVQKDIGKPSQGSDQVEHEQESSPPGSAGEEEVKL
ncbi:MAG: ABC transporter substrate-binding protein/permease, partial [Coriobacteriia bacterium]|nr:ABC transporter substrate-binding protein/permease [Coriobacteriia bacterium]